MKRRIVWVVPVALTLSAANCPPSDPPFSISSVVLSGPSTLPNNGPNGTYTAVVTITRPAGSTAAIQTSSPWWLADQDSGLPGFGEGGDSLSFVRDVIFAAGASTATITWQLGCVGRSVRGTAVTLPGGTPNTPDSGEGNANSFGPDSGPADIVVEYEGNIYGNTLSVTCMCGSSVCP